MVRGRAAAYPRVIRQNDAGAYHQPDDEDRRDRQQSLCFEKLHRVVSSFAV